MLFDMSCLDGAATIDLARLYRMPWTMSDNAFTWLEPTRHCDLRCEYCYQHHDPDSHKSLARIQDELDSMLRLRKTDSMLIAGGEPLTHPKIVEITQLVRSRRVKPVILTNGAAMTSSLLHRLKRAGAFGFIFHVDARQSRPGWEDRSEKQMNELRQRFADMIHEEGDLVCGYNTTILPETLHEVPDIVCWTTDNVDRVAMNVLIPVRAAHAEDPWDYYAGRERLNLDGIPYGRKRRYENITALDICREIWKVHPGYRFHSYLGGTVLADAPKWLFGTHLGSRGALHGNIGSKAVEIVQAAHHVTTGRYLSLLSPMLRRMGRALFPLVIVDRSLRSAYRHYLRCMILRPRSLFGSLYLQSIVVMQPHDILPSGEQDECDGCPNKTYWRGRLVSECRQEDYLRYGRPIMSIPKRAGLTNRRVPPGHRNQQIDDMQQLLQ